MHRAARPIQDFRPAQRTLDVNLTGYLLACKHAIPHINAGGGGSVVNTWVRANSVLPGLVLTEQTKGHLPPDFRDEVLRTTPSFRHGEPADIGAMSAFLLSDLGEWVTGQAICVDGGVTVRP